MLPSTKDQAMAYTVPALRGHMGSTEFYQAIVSARELASVAKLATELADWTQWSVFERFQRELAHNRVEREIVPYLAQARDRFFNSLIVLVYQPDEFVFEAISGDRLPATALHRSLGKKMGFLTIEGGDLVVLDGQHRLAALRAVTTDNTSVSGPCASAVGDDELCVIFIPHESFEKTRRIFNKVNRYAKPTSPSDNIITSEDDGSAIVSRWLVEPTPPLDLHRPRPPFGLTDDSGEPVVEWRRTTLRPQDTKFTTLSTLYQSIQVILAANGLPRFTERHMVNRPSDDQLAKAYTISAEWWNTVIMEFKPYRTALRHLPSLPDHRAFRSRYSLLFRPVGQLAFIQSLLEVQKRGLKLGEALLAASRKNWSASGALFCDTIVYANGHMSTSESSIRLAGRLGAFRIAPDLHSDIEVEVLQEDLARAKGQVRFKLR